MESNRLIEQSMHPGAAELAHVSAIAAIFSISLNALLIGAIWNRSPEMLRYRVVACISVIVDILFSLLHVINVPIFVSIQGTFLFYPARLDGSTHANWISLALFCYLCVCTIFVVTNRFFYRYAQICSPALYSFISNPCFIIFFLLSSVLACASITTIGMSIFLPHKTFANQICIQFNTVLHANFCDKVFLGGSVEETLENPQAMILVCIFLSGVFSAIGMILFFGKQIHMTVSSMNFSPIGQKIHRKTLRILIVQVLIPIIFIYFPIAINVFSVVIYMNTQNITFILSYFIVIFPLANAASHLYFIKDYRAFVFGIIFRPLIKVAGEN
ncbi:hypothetical protein PRIPAC_94821 [Pristionchus pacificus]|uniref:G protein-coupled receptor n=1 Tax=Pristionchus pacificus TaxID=54126 RepID=A0A2A6BPV1_PRIPA|nr:hypothetical protein PRIPAC_94821 [Pristionchus pacificus]|eukprot:PDM67791.1 G protein-coupled receptor [Pristionchus pacificus]